MLGIIVAIAVLNIVLRIPNLPLIKLMDNGTKGQFPMWAVAVIYSLALVNRNLKTWQRVALFVVVGLYVYQYFFPLRLWLSGWLPMFVGLIAVTFFRSKRLFAVMCVALVVIAALRFDDLYTTIFVANADEGGLQRFDMWAINMRHISHHPLFGMGPAGYAVYYMTYNPLTARSTHNNYFDIVAQTGIIGLVSFIVLLGTFCWLSYKTVKATQGRGDALEAFALAAMGGSIAIIPAMMLGDWILPFAYNQTITGFDNAIFTWMMLGGMVALYQLVSRENRKRTRHTRTPMPDQPKPAISIVIINWNTRDLLLRCIQTVLDMRDTLRPEVIVVDNASSDDSVACVRERFPKVVVIENAANVGFARANNQGVRASDAAYSLLLNSDAFLTPGSLQAMMQVMRQQPKVALVGAHLRNADGTFQASHTSFPTLGREFLILSGLGRLLHGKFFPSNGPDEARGTRSPTM